jgi:tetratricopeptide (TPR) repeat protein
MRIVICIASLLFFVSVPTTMAADSVGATALAPAPTKKQKLDSLFVDLKKAKTPAAGEGVARRINEEWADSGSASINVMMQWANQAIETRSYPVALDFLDQVVVLQPKYAEGWNRRATLHFIMNNYSKSMADIERTLELEPRHFGALSGMGQIFRQLERKELALRAYERALEIFPTLRDAQNQVGEIADELSGSRI